jgi:succinate dehydrogenase/fumarate reductase flavoprotein subunit
LVIGGGGAALRAAIACRETGADVLVVSKTRVGLGNNSYLSKASWSMPGLGHPEDSPRVHEKDTLVAGCFINDRKMVERVARGGSGLIPFLEKCGVDFATTDGRMIFDHLPGHTYPRHVRGKNRVGSDLMLPLKGYAERIGVRFLNRVFVTRLLPQGGPGRKGSAGIHVLGDGKGCKRVLPLPPIRHVGERGDHPRW